MHFQPVKSRACIPGESSGGRRATDFEETRIPSGQSRRHFLRTVADVALLSLLPSLARAHGAVGPVRPPLALPPVSVIRQDGIPMSLQSILWGKTTALQLMFTGCSQICPLQGALFAAVQSRLPPGSHDSLQLLSLSIDPLGDDARSLAKWLRQYGASRQWVAAVPGVKDLDRLRTALQESSDGLDNHTGQIFLFNHQARLVWRTENLPPAEVVLRQLTSISAA